MRLMKYYDYDIKESLESLKRFVKFRVEQRPGHIDPALKKECEECSRCFFFYHDKQRNPCVVIKLKYQNYERCGIGNLAKYLLWTIEQASKMARRLGNKKLCVIYDRKDHHKNKINKKALGEAKTLLK